VSPFERFLGIHTEGEIDECFYSIIQNYIKTHIFCDRTSFATLYKFFVPFFFIHLGLQLQLESLSGSWILGLVLLIVAFLGKVIGTGGLALITGGRSSALLLGVSMVPRAEITMMVMERGRELGDWAVSSQIFSTTILVSAITCVVSPLILRPLLQKNSLKNS
ncbi:MAG: cation:proton antiporter, partial [Waterburya sp.]